MPNKRNLKDYGFLVLKGMGMGCLLYTSDAADEL